MEVRIMTYTRLFAALLLCSAISFARANTTHSYALERKSVDPQSLSCPSLKDLRHLNHLGLHGELQHEGAIFEVYLVQGKVNSSVLQDMKGPFRIEKPADLREAMLPTYQLGCLYKRYLFGKVYGAFILVPRIKPEKHKKHD